MKQDLTTFKKLSNLTSKFSVDSQIYIIELTLKQLLISVCPKIFLLLQIVQPKPMLLFIKQKHSITVFRHLYGKLLCRECILLEQYLNMYRAWVKL